MMHFIVYPRLHKPRIIFLFCVAQLHFVIFDVYFCQGFESVAKPSSRGTEAVLDLIAIA